MLLSASMPQSQVLELLRTEPDNTHWYADEQVLMWIDNGVEEFLELDRAMGVDNGENYDFNSNLDM